MTNVTCELTAKKPGSDSAPCPMLMIEYDSTLLVYTENSPFVSLFLWCAWTTETS